MKDKKNDVFGCHGVAMQTAISPSKYRFRPKFDLDLIP